VRAVQPVVFHHVMDGVNAAGWQVVQHPDGLEILLARPRQVAGNAMAVKVRSALAARGVVAPRVAVREVAAIPRTALGKAPLIRAAV
jgi:phenylacetate-CoA ligase